MLSPFNLLLITAGFCLVMLLVLCSLLRSGIAGMKEWLLANALAGVALLLFAGRGTLHPLLTVELANGLLAAAIAMMFAGVRRFFGVAVHGRALAVGLAATVALLALLHYGFDSMALRTLLVSLFHGALCFGIGLTILRHGAGLRLRYPYLFTAVMAFLFGMGHLVRGAVYASSTDVLASLLQPSAWHVVFLSLGTLVLPVFTMGTIMMTHDRMLAQAVEHANRDFLTGAWSRRALFELAAAEFVRAGRTQGKLSVVLLDVDHFKAINDTFGHAAGDEVLVDVARQASAAIRSVDCFARLGGEEFAVLLPETSLLAAQQVAERLRAALARQLMLPVSRDDVRLASYTVSLGVAELGADESFSELLQRADAALYAAKAAGRNRVEVSRG